MLNGRKPWSWSVWAIAFVAIAAGCTPARHEVQTDLVKSISFHGNGGAFTFDQGDYALAGAMAQGDSGFGATLWPLMYWVSPEAYDPVALDADAWRLEIWYAHHGWFDARFDGWEVIRVRPRREKFGGVVKIVGHVVPGAPSEIRGYDITGLDTTPLKTFRASLERTGPLAVGEQFAVDDLDGAVGQLEDSLHNNGFPYGAADAEIGAFPEEHVVDLVIHADAGTFARFGPTTISGNVKVAERVLRDSLSFEEGETWDARELTRTQDHIFQLGTFAVVNVEPDLSDPTQTEVPVSVSVTEAQFQTLRLGAGASYRGATLTPRVSVTYTHANLFSRLIQLEARGQLGYGFRPQRGQAGLSDGTLVYLLGLDVSTPYLGSPKYGLYVGGEIKQDIQNGQYTYFNPTAYFGFTWKPIDDFVLAAGPEFELYKFSDLDAEGELLAKQIFGPEFTNPYILTKLAVRASWDRRDDPVSPTRGQYYAGGIEQAFPIQKWVGGDTAFVYTQLNADARFYIRPRLGRSVPLVGAVRFAGKWLIPWPGNSYMPYPEKAFLGGATTVRGFLIDQVGPYDCICTHNAAEDGNGFTPVPGANDDTEFAYLPKGGVLTLNTMGEARYNFGGAQSLAVFADFGIVVERSQIYDAISPRLGGGVGYRYDTPVGPFRLDLGVRPLYPEDKGPVSTPGCQTSDHTRPRSYDVVGALFPKQRDDEFRVVPFALNVYIAIGEAF